MLKNTEDEKQANEIYSESKCQENEKIEEINKEDDEIWKEDASIYDLFNGYVYGAHIIDLRDWHDFDQSHIHLSINVDIDYPGKSLIQFGKKIICIDYPKTDNNDNYKTKISVEKYKRFYTYCVEKKGCKSFRITSDNFDFGKFAKLFPAISPSSADETGPDRKKYPNIILPNKLYLGDMWNRNSIQSLKELGITHIIDATKEDFNNKDKFKILKIALPDTPTAPIDKHFNAAIGFIDKALSDDNNNNNNNNRVLIHCQMGISRSSTLTIAYLMKSKGYTLYDAYKIVKNNRPRIRPNEGFYARLIQFEMDLFDGKSTKQQIEKEKLRDINNQDCIVM